LFSYRNGRVSGQWNTEKSVALGGGVWFLAVVYVGRIRAGVGFLAVVYVDRIRAGVGFLAVGYVGSGVRGFLAVGYVVWITS